MKFEIFLPLAVASVLTFMSQPPIERIGAYAGPYWSEGHSYNSLTRLTTGVTAHGSFGGRWGFEFGLAYKQSGYQWDCGFWCFLYEDEGFDEGDTLLDYIEATALGRARIVDDDVVMLDLLLGPSYGIEVACLERNHTRGMESQCPGDAGFDVRVVAGTTLSVHVSPRIDLTASYRYGINPLAIPVEEDGGDDIADASLLMGVAWRLGS